MADSLLNGFTANPLGGALFRFIKPVVHLVRRTLNPGLPDGFVDAKVRYGNQFVSLRHRRWNQDDMLAIKQCFVSGQYDMPTGKQALLVKRLYQDILARGPKAVDPRLWS